LSIYFKNCINDKSLDKYNGYIVLSINETQAKDRHNSLYQHTFEDNRLARNAEFEINWGAFEMFQLIFNSCYGTGAVYKLVLQNNNIDIVVKGTTKEEINKYNKSSNKVKSANKPYYYKILPNNIALLVFNDCVDITRDK